MTVRLTTESFFKYYLLRPLSSNLNRHDRIKALTGSVALGIFTLGMTQLICRLFVFNLKFAKIPNQDNPVSSATDTVFKSKQSSQSEKIQPKANPPQVEKVDSEKIQPKATPPQVEKVDSEKIQPKATPPQVEKVDLTEYLSSWNFQGTELGKTSVFFFAEDRKELARAKEENRDPNYSDELKLAAAFVDRDPATYLRELGNRSVVFSSNGAEYSEVSQAWQERLALLKQHKLYGERIDKLNLEYYLEEITVTDLEESLDNSALKIALMTREEIQSLTLGDIEKLSALQKKYLFLVRYKSRRTSSNQSPPLDTANWKSLTISELWQIDPKTMSDDLLQSTWYLLTPQQLKQIKLHHIDLQGMDLGAFLIYTQPRGVGMGHFANEDYIGILCAFSGKQLAPYLFSFNHYHLDQLSSEQLNEMPSEDVIKAIKSGAFSSSQCSGLRDDLFNAFVLYQPKHPDICSEDLAKITPKTLRELDAARLRFVLTGVSHAKKDDPKIKERIELLSDDQLKACLLKMDATIVSLIPVAKLALLPMDLLTQMDPFILRTLFRGRSDEETKERLAVLKSTDLAMLHTSLEPILAKSAG